MHDKKRLGLLTQVDCIHARQSLSRHRMFANRCQKDSKLPKLPPQVWCHALWRCISRACSAAEGTVIECRDCVHTVRSDTVPAIRTTVKNFRIVEQRRHSWGEVSMKRHLLILQDVCSYTNSFLVLHVWLVKSAVILEPRAFRLKLVSKQIQTGQSAVHWITTRSLWAN